MATYVNTQPTQEMDPIKGVKKMPLEEYFTSGHRTCRAANRPW